MTNRIRVTLISVSSLLVFYVVLGGLLGKSDSARRRPTATWEFIAKY